MTIHSFISMDNGNTFTQEMNTSEDTILIRCEDVDPIQNINEITSFKYDDQGRVILKVAIIEEEGSKVVSEIEYP